MQKKQNTFYLVFNNLDGVFNKSGDNKYLIFSSTEKNRVMLENYAEVFDEITEQIESITGGEVKYSKDTLKVKLKASDDLPFGEIINVPVCVIVISSIFQENNEYYPQISLDDCFYEYTNPLDM